MDRFHHGHGSDRTTGTGGDGGGGGTGDGVRHRSSVKIRLGVGPAAGPGDLSVLASTLDPLVGILVERTKVLPQFTIGRTDHISLANVGKLLRQ